MSGQPAQIGRAGSVVPLLPPAAVAAPDADQRGQRRRGRDAAGKGAAARAPVLVVVGGVVEARVALGAAISGVQNLVEGRGAAGGNEAHDAAEPDVVGTTATGAAWGGGRKMMMFICL